jgi:hypothetical protein
MGGKQICQRTRMMSLFRLLIAAQVPKLRIRHAAPI